MGGKEKFFIIISQELQTTLAVMKDSLDERMDAWTRDFEEVGRRHVELIKTTGRILDLRLTAEMLGDRLDDFENDFLY